MSTQVKMQSAAEPATPTAIAIKLHPDAHKDAMPQSHDAIANLLEKSSPGASRALTVSPLITTVPPGKLDELVKRAAQMDPEYKPVDFRAWYHARLEPAEGDKAVSRDDGAFDPKIPGHVDNLISQLHELPEVESAFHLTGCPPPVDASDDVPYAPLEHFLDAAPLGIDARYAWNYPGGDGKGVGFVDMEQGWDLLHPDLKDSNVTLISGDNTAYHFHGTGVLGEVLMTDNAQGGIGIAPQVTGRVISQYQSGVYNTAAAILGASAVMKFGDVLLLEAQARDNSMAFLPVEINDGVYDAIRLTTALGIIVVEAAANGSVDLDTWKNPAGLQILNRSSDAFRDSGAIMVGAGSSKVPHTRLGFSNYGSRIDCYGWGENVTTTYTNDPWLSDQTQDPKIQGAEIYTLGFSGTSSASPIVAGAAILVQGIVMNQSGATNPNPNLRFAPLEMRRLLSTIGTPSANPASDRIGILPDLKAIITSSIINLAPDVYIRDFIGDIGDANTGVFSSSPDIIVRQNPVPDPQGTFGQGSVNQDSVSLSQEVIEGQNNYINIRLRNRGGTDATTVNTTVYWSPPSTLVTPDLWTAIGQTTIPNVPAGNILTVSDALTWPAASIPPAGHYCFIAITGNALDPAPDPAAKPAVVFPTSDDYFKFIAVNNNIAWKNFNVISSPPSDGPEMFHTFPFIIPGTFDISRSFAVEALGALPKGSEVELVLPLSLAKQFKIFFQEGQVQGEQAVIPLPIFGKRRIGAGVFEKGAKSDCKIRIRVPQDTYTREGAWEFGVRQLLVGRDGEKEVGRLTWRFGQAAQIGEGPDNKEYYPEDREGKYPTDGDNGRRVE